MRHEFSEWHMNDQPRFTAFDDSRRLASGSRRLVTQAIKSLLSNRPTSRILIFDDATGSQVDFDLRETGDESTPTAPASGEEARSPGRPKLGVIAREVTLLPRHWDWLARQPGGASVTLRKLVEEARRINAGAPAPREAQERAYRFMSAMGGNLPGFEEAARALFASDRPRFETHVAHWPENVRDYACALAEGAFAPSV
jgi:hypothetical protein